MSKTVSGAVASFKLNGDKVAFASSVNITEENNLLEIPVLDQSDVAEHAETTHRVSFTVGYFKTDTTSVSKLGIRADDIDDILTQPELTAEIFNRKTGEVLYKISGVKFEGGDGSIEPSGVWAGTWRFRGRSGSGL